MSHLFGASEATTAIELVSTSSTAAVAKEVANIAVDTASTVAVAVSYNSEVVVVYREMVASFVMVVVITSFVVAMVITSSTFVMVAPTYFFKVSAGMDFW